MDFLNIPSEDEMSFTQGKALELMVKMTNKDTSLKDKVITAQKLSRFLQNYMLKIEQKWINRFREICTFESRFGVKIDYNDWMSFKVTYWNLGDDTNKIQTIFQINQYSPDEAYAEIVQAEKDFAWELN